MKPLATKLTKRLFGAAILSAALITPAIASAQDYAYGGDRQIAGTIASIDGMWNITVNDANGYSDSVELHQGTIINPTGLTLEPGMNVTIAGYGDGANFEANEIDTPYQYQGPAPVAVYYGPGSWYPGYAQGWGPSFTLAFNIGTRSWQQRPFAFGGRVRQVMTPPAGWQNQQHGFIGNARPSQRVVYAPQQRPPQPQRAISAPPAQPQRNFAPRPAQQPQRNAAAPAHRNTAPVARNQNRRHG